MIVILIKNSHKILAQPLTEDEIQIRKRGLKCLELAIKAVRPSRLIENALKVQNRTLNIEDDSFHLDQYENIYIIGGGKATAEMAFTLTKICEEQVNIQDIKGYINIPEGLEIEENDKPKSITINYATHPIPNESGMNGVKEMMNLVQKANANDLIFCLISGGGSALMPLPRENITLEELKEVNSLLLESGASIQEINAIRKHLSRFKGGNLAKVVHQSDGATLIALIISDVIGDDLDSIASGPTVPDSTTFQDAINVLKRYDLWDQVADSIKSTLENGVKENSLENPKEGDSCFTNVYNYLIGSVKESINHVSEFLQQEGYETEYFSDDISGEAKEFGEELFDIIEENKEKMEEEHIAKKALLGSGELTVTIHSDGIGGRNQEMLVSLLDYCIDNPIDFNFLVIGANLDGIEGNSKAMGGLIDSALIDLVREKYINLEAYLLNNDSNSFFKKVNTELITGLTGCNVNDIVIVLIDS